MFGYCSVELGSGLLVWHTRLGLSAFGGTTRFDDFQRKLGMSRNLLSTRLKRLVQAGVLERRAISAEGRRQEYILTEMGEDLLATIVALRQWGDRWLFRPEPYPADMIDAVDGSKVEPLVVRSGLGRAMTRLDLRLKKTARASRKQSAPAA